MLGSTIFALIWSVLLANAAGVQTVGMARLATLAMIFWLGVFVVSLPSAGIVLTLLWPITRRRTQAAGWLCIIAGATLGIVLAPIASPEFRGTTGLQLSVFGLTGAAIAAIYLFLTKRSDRWIS